MTDRDGRPDARREPELRREHDAVHEWHAGQPQRCRSKRARSSVLRPPST
jgi:hypothetical protein